jgi:hypothetical protein
MNEIEGLYLLDYLATGLNKTDPVLQAIFSNFEGEGAIANEIDELIAFIDYYTKTDDVRGHKSDALEMIIKTFTKLNRHISEPDNIFLRRMLALTERKGDVIWGNAVDIEHVFETYFADIKAYVCENTNKDNLLPDGDFEKDDDWHLEGGASFEYGSRFSEKRGLHFDGTAGAFCSQHLGLLNPAVYVLHFFLLGKCGVIIKNSEDQYWNADENTLAWSDDEIVNRFESVEFRDVFCFLRLTDNAPQLEIRFVSLDGEEASIDYARLFAKPKNPSYTIVIQYEGYTLSEKTLHLGSGNVDPDPDIDYSKESYFDHSYIVGRKGAYRSEVYKNVLDTVRPRGIEVFVEFIEKIIED